MAKINTGTITVANDGTWSSNAISMTAGSKRAYLRQNGVELFYRDFTVPFPPPAVESGFPTMKHEEGYVTTIWQDVTTAGASYLVAFVGGLGNNNGAWPLTSVAGGGLSWSKITNASSNTGGIYNLGNEAWYAKSTGALNTQRITATVGASETQWLGGMTIYSITGAHGTTPIGGAGVLCRESSGTMQTTLTASSASSLILVGLWTSDGSTVPTAYSFNSPWADTDQDLSNNFAYAVASIANTSTGSKTFGVDGSLSVGGIAGVEFLPP